MDESLGNMKQQKIKSYSTTCANKLNEGTNSMNATKVDEDGTEIDKTKEENLEAMKEVADFLTSTVTDLTNTIKGKVSKFQGKFQDDYQEDDEHDGEAAEEARANTERQNADTINKLKKTITEFRLGDSKAELLQVGTGFKFGYTLWMYTRLESSLNKRLLIETNLP